MQIQVKDTVILIHEPEERSGLNLTSLVPLFFFPEGVEIPNRTTCRKQSRTTVPLGRRVAELKRLVDRLADMQKE